MNRLFWFRYYLAIKMAIIITPLPLREVIKEVLQRYSDAIDNIANSVKEDQ